MLTPPNSKIAVLGLGYVGLPLAVAFGSIRSTVGFDINQARVDELRRGEDRTLEIDSGELVASRHLRVTGDPADLAGCNVFIVTIPTPIDQSKRPDPGALFRASETIGRVLKRGDVVVYESTVYPRATEEECVPILERMSGLRFNTDFFAGYSPERANPGDRKHRLTSIMKVTSGSTPETAEFVDALYREIVTAGTHKAPSIKVAEAAKVIENTQRDLNIALINELAIIFSQLGIDTEDVLLAAGTKRNFIPFWPGLFSGHCIGVDPYYLTHKAQSVGYNPETSRAGRRINNGMGKYVVTELVRAMIRKGIDVTSARVLILGLAFKENCPDLRNTRVVDIVGELAGFGVTADGIQLVAEPDTGACDAIIIAVAHNQFRELGPEGVRAFARQQHVVYDIKYVLPASVAMRL